MLSFSQKGGIIVQGDYNARTGEIHEVVMNDDNTFLPIMLTLRLNYLVKLWWKHVRKPA